MSPGQTNAGARVRAQLIELGYENIAFMPLDRACAEIARALDELLARRKRDPHPIQSFASGLQPEPCLSDDAFAPDVCRSPIACSAWGYCRQRNLPLAGEPDAATQAAFRADAKARAT